MRLSGSERVNQEGGERRFSLRDCPKSLGGACNVALRATETVLFGSFWPPCTGQIHDGRVSAYL